MDSAIILQYHSKDSHINTTYNTCGPQYIYTTYIRTCGQIIVVGPNESVGAWKVAIYSKAIGNSCNSTHNSQCSEALEAAGIWTAKMRVSSLQTCK